jgi:hypothetical protein
LVFANGASIEEVRQKPTGGKHMDRPRARDLLIIDADSHFHEPADWLATIDKQLAEQLPPLTPAEQFLDVVVGDLFASIPPALRPDPLALVPQPIRDGYDAHLKGLGEPTPQAIAAGATSEAAYLPEPRLKWMDARGIDVQLLLPSRGYHPYRLAARSGDVPLTLSQLLPLSGAVIVCTPQIVAQDDARRAAKMFEQLGVPVIELHTGLYAELAGAAQAEELRGVKFFTVEQIANASDGQLQSIGMIGGMNAHVMRDRAKTADPDGTGGLRTWNASRPPFVEADAVQRAALVAQVAGCPLYVVHTSSAAALEAAVRMRRAGAAVFIETCPHYLTHDVDWAGGDTGKINPPLREAADREALWAAVADGTVDTIGTDHVHRDGGIFRAAGDERTGDDNFINSGVGLGLGVCAADHPECQRKGQDRGATKISAFRHMVSFPLVSRSLGDGNLDS